MKTSHDSNLGLVVYCWGLEEQSRLIAGCLAPAATELRPALRLFWFDRFDARGPHVFALFTLPSGEEGRARDLLGQRLEEYLEIHPSRQELTPEELAARHQACRGKALCAVDAWPELAENNSFFWFPHPATGYPFSIGRGLPEPERLGDLLDELTGWAVEQLARSSGATPTSAAAHWLAALSHSLLDRCAEPDAYWRHHAATLGLRCAADPLEAVAALGRALGESTGSQLRRVWDGARTHPLPCPPLARLTDLALEQETPWALLREIVHITLKQLGVPVKSQIPLLLFAWQHSLSERLARSPSAQM
jgi:hypothetical protein